MLTILVTGMLLTALSLGVLWGGFLFLRKKPKYDHFNSKAANKKMLQLTILLYFSGFVLTIYFMATAEPY